MGPRYDQGATHPLFRAMFRPSRSLMARPPSQFPCISGRRPTNAGTEYPPWNITPPLSQPLLALRNTPHLTHLALKDVPNLPWKAPPTTKFTMYGGSTPNAPVGADVHSGRIDVHKRLRFQGSRPTRGCNCTHAFPHHRVHKCGGLQRDMHHHDSRVYNHAYGISKNPQPNLVGNLHGLVVQSSCHQSTIPQHGNHNLTSLPPLCASPLEYNGAP